MANTILTSDQMSTRILQLIRKVAEEKGVSEIDLANAFSRKIFGAPK